MIISDCDRVLCRMRKSIDVSSASCFAGDLSSLSPTKEELRCLMNHFDSSGCESKRDRIIVCRCYLREGFVLDVTHIVKAHVSLLFSGS